VLRHRGVHDEPPVLRVLEEHALEMRVVAVGAQDDGLEIVLHQPPDHTAEEDPGGLQAVQHGAEVLAQGDPEERVAAAAEGDQQAIDGAPAPGGGIEPKPQAAEVDFGGLARRRVGDAHRHRRRPEVAGRAGEPVERAVGDGHALRA
jgi:hypothetical protein